ncbi:MAG: ABC transporter ATP-binding protein [Candidatus Obscuribacterales bacterium]|nr:ABC transporter ATP-binding protein [Candidatus Obscuribacterales bacterium]
MSALCIQTKDVTKKFGENVALSNINLSIEEGEFFSFLGPSGCGKTTLLRIIAGFESLTSGSLLIDGQDVSKIPAHKRPVNMVFQNYALFPHLTIADNVAFGLVARGNKDKNDIRTKVTEALQLVRLEQFASRYPQQLSGGQQQRVALARAVINRPRVLLLDEPLSALDPQIREQMQEELKSLQRALNLTFIMVTHDQSEALAMSHRLAVFSAGRIEQIGQPRDVYEKPASVFVARFIGQTNLLEATVKEIGRDFILVDCGQENLFRIPCDDTKTDAKIQLNDSVFLYVKPQAIRFVGTKSPSSGSGGDGINAFDAVVESASYQGHTTEYVLKMKNDCRLKVVAAGLECKSEGDTVQAAFDILDCSFLKAASEKEPVALAYAKV